MQVLLDELRFVGLIEWMVHNVHVRIIVEGIIVHVSLRVQWSLFRIVEHHLICVVMRAQHILLGGLHHVGSALFVLIK